MNEHSKFSGLASMGGTFGTIFIYPACGLILTYYDWAAVFHVSFVATAAWCVLWYFCVTDDPADHKWISEEEKVFILNNRVASLRSTQSAERSFPLKAIVTSVPVLANAFCSFANDWGLYILLTEGPNFISKVLEKDIATVSSEYNA